MRAWWLATWQIVFTPGRFYRRLRMRGRAGRDQAFASWTYRAIVAGALLWVLAVAVYDSRNPLRPDWLMLVSICSFFSVAAAIGCWIGHRIIAAAVFTWWALRSPLPDGRWAAKVIAYESAFLWVFCTFWGLLVTSFMLFDEWISRSLAPHARWFLLAPAEFWVVVLGTCGLGAVWLWRYRIAYRAIRWSNF